MINRSLYRKLYENAEADNWFLHGVTLRQVEQRAMVLLRRTRLTKGEREACEAIQDEC